MRRKASQGTLARLKRALQRAGITQQRIATDLGVTIQHVCHVFAGRHVNARVVAHAKKLLAEASATPAKGAA